LGYIYKIFISSTIDDLREERLKIGIEVMKTENVAFLAEYFMDVHDFPRVALEKKVDECDGYIGIFHKKWGSVPKKDNPEQLSATAIVCL
jgi:Domain of unknown function (DUF4062)